MSVDKAVTGKIKFYDHYKPRLRAGKYRVDVEQTLELRVDPGEVDGATGIADLRYEDPESVTYQAHQYFHVTAPRFRLGPDDVQAVYPPGNSQGDFADTLPHIVLRQRVLPWARPLDQGSPDSDAPWMGLLLFHGDEAPQIVTRTVDEIVSPAGEDDASGPAIDLHPELDDRQARAYAIDVSRELFEAICPRENELPLLSHVRRVSTADKELQGMMEDGWYSVVVGNRLPDEHGGLNTAHLVSLEGWKSLLDGTRDDVEETLRLVSLASWSFTSEPARGSFQELMDDIDSGLLRVELPESVRDRGDSAAQLVTAAVDDGYVPLNYETWLGEATAGWFRGPLLPVKVARDDKDPYESAEAALIYDPRTGLFDASYAVAWQIGRLLALSDGEFTAALGQWRREGHQALDRLLQNLGLADRFSSGEFAGFRQLEELDDILPEVLDAAREELQQAQRILQELKAREAAERGEDELQAAEEAVRQAEEKLARIAAGEPEAADFPAEVVADLARLENELARMAIEPAASPNGNAPAEDEVYERLVRLVEAYLKKLIEDVQEPRAMSRQLFEKVIKNKVQRELILPEGDKAPLATVPIDKERLTFGLAELTETDTADVLKEQDLPRRASAIRDLLLGHVGEVT